MPNGTMRLMRAVYAAAVLANDEKKQASTAITRARQATADKLAENVPSVPRFPSQADPLFLLGEASWLENASENGDAAGKN